MANNETSQETNLVEITFGTAFNQYTPDEFEQFYNLRAFIDQNTKQFYFIGSEVAELLGYANPWDAIRELVPDSLKMNYRANSSGIPKRGNPNVILIHEFGLYALATRSTLPSALNFQQWVYKTIQDIRMYGSSMSPKLIDVIEFDSEQLARIANCLREEVGQLKQQLQELTSKFQEQEAYHNSFINPMKVYTSTEVAKDFGLSARTLHTLLEELHIIYRINGTFELYQQYSSYGYTKSRNFKTPNGVKVTQTGWTEYGREFLYKILTENGLTVGGDNIGIVRQILAQCEQLKMDK